MTAINLPIPLAAAAGPAPAGAKILIVDDEPVNIKVARRYLQMVGYQNFVTVTESPRAMEVIRTTLHQEGAPAHPGATTYPRGELHPPLQR